MNVNHHLDDEWQKPIRYVTIHFHGQRGAATLRYRSRAEITVLRCKQEPIRYGFSVVSSETMIVKSRCFI